MAIILPKCGAICSFQRSVHAGPAAFYVHRHFCGARKLPHLRQEYVVASLGTSCSSSPDDIVTLAAAGLAILGAAALPYGADALTQYLAPRKCRFCHGAGYLSCPTCHGRGKVGGCLPGLELQSCELCAARGRVRCEPCRHTGLTNYWLWLPADDPGWGARGS
ncbi:hypothetical protein VaNZ11_014601 [Volvox africanus]|uniref:Uncharacterized protein n=1 Tax=Volvox africanus TaxID=51714 RepID=A0ABQ5SJE8_9CHLO|nr:hypothetical protein VaNZ11_014601 [Volvox africanus]